MRHTFARLATVVAVPAVLAACSSPNTSSGPSTITSAATTPAVITTEATPPVPTAQTSPSRTSADGAVVAAIGFLELTERVTSMTPDEAAVAQASISADSVREVLAAKTRDEVEHTLAAYDVGTIHLRITPLAARRTDSATGTTVALWYLGVFTVDHGTASSFFRTATYTLVWEHDTWRMTSLESTPGPTPMPTKDAYLDSALQLTAALDGFTSVADQGAGR
jgi:hypothetical protein